MRIASTTLLGLVLLCSSFTESEAGQVQTGTVAGRILDQTGAALPGVIVDLVSGRTELTSVSDHRGDYRFEGVPAGLSELTFRLINFAVLRRTVSVRDGQVVVSDAVLTLSIRADVVVTGRSTFRNIADVEDPAENLVGIASASSQGAITAAQLEARPTMRPGEVMETVPGMMVSQHSGEAKPTSTTSADSIWITGPTSQRAWLAFRSTHRPARTRTVTRMSAF